MWIKGLNVEGKRKISWETILENVCGCVYGHSVFKTIYWKFKSQGEKMSEFDYIEIKKKNVEKELK